MGFEIDRLRIELRSLAKAMCLVAEHQEVLSKVVFW